MMAGDARSWGTIEKGDWVLQGRLRLDEKDGSQFDNPLLCPQLVMGPTSEK